MSAPASAASATVSARSTAGRSRRRTDTGLDELILTVLSQSTNDRNRDVAFMALRDRFGSWEAVRDAPNADVELAIRPGGISKIKSARIQDILREIDDRGLRRAPRGRCRSSRAARN